MKCTIKNLELVFKLIQDNHIDNDAGGADFAEYDDESDLLGAVERAVEMIEEEFLDRPFATMFSDGHDETFEYFHTREEAIRNFELLKLSPEDGCYLYERHPELGLEVIDSYSED